MNDIGRTIHNHVKYFSVFGLFLVTMASGTPLPAQTLRGTVKDAATGAPLVDASVVLLDDDGRIQRGTLTEPDGSFVIMIPDNGVYTLRVGAAAYLVQDTPPLQIEEGQDGRVDVLLQPENRSSGPPVGFTARMAAGEGEFITPEQIEERSGNMFTDLFRYTPAVRVVPLPASYSLNSAEAVMAQPSLFSRRDAGTVGSITQALTLRIKSGRGVVGAVQRGESTGDCVPVLWVDGVWWGSIDQASPTGPNGALQPGDLEAIEVYNYLLIVPDQFNSGRDSECGVVVVWRKRSRQE